MESSSGSNESLFVFEFLNNLLYMLYNYGDAFTLEYIKLLACDRGAHKCVFERERERGYKMIVFCKSYLVSLWG